MTKSTRGRKNALLGVPLTMIGAAGLAAAQSALPASLPK
jgi:hypothetical protein